MTDRTIVFASGKGGTGKTTVAVNLACFLAYSQQPVQYLDCDVEEPNGHIFLKPEYGEKIPSKVMTPVVDQARCTFCGECSSHCQYHAIVALPGNTLVFPELCHGCNLCVRICPEGALAEGEREIGYIEKGPGKEHIECVQGVLNVGEPMSGPLIQAVKRYSGKGRIRIVDAPPGTSCPVVKTIVDANLVVMVTEPTPFGLHDLKIAVAVAKDLGKPVGVVVNRQNGTFPPLDAYLSENSLPLLMALPEDREIAGHYARGNCIIETLPIYIDQFMELAVNIGRLLVRTGSR